MTQYFPRTNSRREKESNLDDFRLAAGLFIREVCKQAGVRPSAYSSLNSGISAPFNARGELSPSAKKLCTFFNAEPSDLFPRYACDFRRLKEPLVYAQAVDMGFGKPVVLDDPADRYEQLEDIQRLHATLHTLDPREEEVLHMRFGFNEYAEHTLDEIAEKFDISRERARQIEKKALNRLRHSSRRASIRGPKGRTCEVCGVFYEDPCTNAPNAKCLCPEHYADQVKKENYESGLQQMFRLNAALVTWATKLRAQTDTCRQLQNIIYLEAAKAAQLAQKDEATEYLALARAINPGYTVQPELIDPPALKTVIHDYHKKHVSYSYPWRESSSILMSRLISLSNIVAKYNRGSTEETNT